MIKFFRNIRQNLLNEGKTTKYLKYAIGEIVLVMIGILLALQVNNWNEGRKSINEGKKLIGSIYLELREANIKIDSIISALKKQRDDGIEVAEVLEHQDNHPITNPNLFKKIGFSLTTFIFVERNETAWDGLKASGKQAIIRNDTLANLLNEFYSGFDRLITNFNEIPKKARMDLRELIAQCHNSEDLKYYSENGPGIHVKNIQNENCILSLDVLPKLVSSITMSSIVNIELFKDLKLKNQQTLSYIENNLGDIIHPKH